jgi:hypothetical protein
MNTLCQYFSPGWLASMLVDRYFRSLNESTKVVEPSCGYGTFLNALPDVVPAIGVEIDPVVADEARRLTNRPIVTGDFLEVEVSRGCAAVIGNPPFRATLIDQFLRRSFDLLVDEGKVGFILPAYYFNSALRVVEHLKYWSLSQELLPRNAFNGRMREPLLFALFIKDRKRSLVGFALYEEEVSLKTLTNPYRHILTRTKGSIWRAVCRLALWRIGARASLSTIYRELENNRPSNNPFWREKIRQTLNHYDDFVRCDAGTYSLAENHSTLANEFADVDQSYQRLLPLAV